MGAEQLLAIVIVGTVGIVGIVGALLPARADMLPALAFEAGAVLPPAPALREEELLFPVFARLPLAPALLLGVLGLAPSVDELGAA